MNFNVKWAELEIKGSKKKGVRQSRDDTEACTAREKKKFSGRVTIPAAGAYLKLVKDNHPDAGSSKLVATMHDHFLGKVAMGRIYSVSIISIEIYQKELLNG